MITIRPVIFELSCVTARDRMQSYFYLLQERLKKHYDHEIIFWQRIKFSIFRTQIRSLCALVDRRKKRIRSKVYHAFFFALFSAALSTWDVLVKCKEFNRCPLQMHMFWCTNTLHRQREIQSSNKTEERWEFWKSSAFPMPPSSS